MVNRKSTNIILSSFITVLVLCTNKPACAAAASSSSSASISSAEAPRSDLADLEKDGEQMKEVAESIIDYTFFEKSKATAEAKIDKLNPKILKDIKIESRRAHSKVMLTWPTRTLSDGSTVQLSLQYGKDQDMQLFFCMDYRNRPRELRMHISKDNPLKFKVNEFGVSGLFTDGYTLGVLSKIIESEKQLIAKREAAIRQNAQKQRSKDEEEKRLKALEEQKAKEKKDKEDRRRQEEQAEKDRQAVENKKAEEEQKAEEAQKLKAAPIKAKAPEKKDDLTPAFLHFLKAGTRTGIQNTPLETLLSSFKENSDNLFKLGGSNPEYTHIKSVLKAEQYEGLFDLAVSYRINRRGDADTDKSWARQIEQMGSDPLPSAVKLVDRCKNVLQKVISNDSNAGVLETIAEIAEDTLVTGGRFGLQLNRQPTDLELKVMVAALRQSGERALKKANDDIEEAVVQLDKIYLKASIKSSSGSKDDGKLFEQHKRVCFIVATQAFKKEPAELEGILLTKGISIPRQEIKQYADLYDKFG